MKKIINQAPIVRYRAFVSEIFFPDFWNKAFSVESHSYQSLMDELTRGFILTYGVSSSQVSVCRPIRSCILIGSLLERVGWESAITEKLGFEADTLVTYDSNHGQTRFKRACE